ncbi:MAG: hypothetical protein R3F56_06020 [Planctomycetota bacterium]
MAKLPVNLILYSLYAASAGLIGGIGWTFYATWLKREESRTEAFQKRVADRVDSHLEVGRKAQPERQNWRYDVEARDNWWTKFGKVNLIGALPPEPEAPVVEEKKEPVKDAGVPIDSLVVLESLLLEVSKVPAVGGPSATGTGAGGAEPESTSHVVVRYKPGVEVHPPADVVAPAAGQPAWGGPGDSTRPSGAPTPPIPLAGGQVELRQFVHIDETLWPPHNTLRLTRISEDGQVAYFTREDPAKDRSEWKEEPLEKNELELPTEVVRALREARGQKGTEKAGDATDVEPPPSGPDIGDWQDPSETREIKPGQVHVSRRDYDYIRDNSDKVFNDEVAVRTWKARVGNYEGLLVDRLSPRLQNFGIQPGDVILSINGEKVKNKANAYSIGRRQYDGGTRRFLVEILSGRGTGVETRTVTVPQK